MRRTLIRDYKSLEFQRLNKVLGLLTHYREGELREHIPFIRRLEISQYYLALLEKQLATEPEVVAQLVKHKKETLFNNLYYLNHAARLLSRLKERKIDCIVLKGLSFINHLYEDIGLRPFGDLDLLIHREDVRGFLEVMEQEGFNLKCEVKDSDNTDDFDMYNAETKVKIDILTTLNGGFYFSRYYNLDTSQIWERKKLVKIQDTETYRLSEEDELLYSIVHLAFHLNFHVEIKWLFDLRYFLEKYKKTLDTGYIIEQVRKAGLTHVIFAVTEIMYWIFQKDYSAVFGIVKPRFYLFDKTWLRFYAFPPRLFGICLEFPGVINRMAITFMKYSLISIPKKKWKFITDRVFPDFDRITFAYTQRFRIPLKLYFPMIRMLFLLLSPVFLTCLFVIFLGSTVIVKIILLKQTFLYE
ncbi:MAG: nucleotidyltransferase family protein [bacterium]